MVNVVWKPRKKKAAKNPVMESDGTCSSSSEDGSEKCERQRKIIHKKSSGHSPNPDHSESQQVQISAEKIHSDELSSEIIVGS
eukprot:CAMPEP_0113949366 /NCGR_PEP_ID=MMETSP1339-20121228/75365_1 /TAXON_ID=94617 /ORGANISM="Fibrocapsa japonica" /LENGTH=82 /DNA_ID=CAMNT_0000956783 /DNA_START=230 /DNA_END=475 /DNA_ORIENTATION=- /assembly_acc=CAM_ASM_000762